MRTIVKYLIFPFFICWICNFTSSAQTTLSGGVGLMLLNIENPNSLELSETSGREIQFKDSEGWKYPTMTLQASLNKQLGERFTGTYNFKFFIRKYSAEYCICGAFEPINDFEGYSQVMSSVHSMVINFEPFENFRFGFGPFYHFTNVSAFKWVHDPIPFYRSGQQAGVVGNVGYSKEKWIIALQFFESIGGMFAKGEGKAAEQIRMLELSLLYELRQFKTKKERRKQKGKKYR